MDICILKHVTMYVVPRRQMTIRIQTFWNILVYKIQHTINIFIKHLSLIFAAYFRYDRYMMYSILEGYLFFWILNFFKLNKYQFIIVWGVRPQKHNGERSAHFW